MFGLGVTGWILFFIVGFCYWRADVKLRREFNELKDRLGVTEYIANGLRKKVEDLERSDAATRIIVDKLEVKTLPRC